METNFIKKKELNREIILNISKKNITKKILLKKNELSKTLNIKGFRKGFIPLNIITKFFGEEIYNNIINKIINDEFNTIIKQKQISVVNNPKQKIIEENKDFIKILLEFEVFPYIKINLNNLKIKKYFVTITDTDIVNEIDKLRSLHGQWINNHLICEKNNIVTIDLYNKIHDKILFVYENKSFKLDLSNDDIKLKNFLLNKKLKHTYDYNFNNDKLFLRIKNIQKNKLSKIDNMFFEKIKFNNKSELNLNDFIKNKLNLQINNISENLLQKDLLTELLNMHKFILPKTLLENNNNDISTLKIQLIFKQIKKDFNINVSDIEINKEIKNININKDQINDITNKIMFNKIIKIIKTKISIDYNEICLKTLFKKVN